MTQNKRQILRQEQHLFPSFIGEKWGRKTKTFDLMETLLEQNGYAFKRIKCGKKRGGNRNRFLRGQDENKSLIEKGGILKTMAWKIGLVFCLFQNHQEDFN